MQKKSDCSIIMLNGKIANAEEMANWVIVILRRSTNAHKENGPSRASMSFWSSGGGSRDHTVWRRKGTTEK